MTTGLPGYEKAPRRSPRSAVTPHSSRVSRSAASSRVSPRSTWPPGNVQSPYPGSMARFTRRTRSSRTMRMPAAIFVSIQWTAPQRTHTGTFFEDTPTACSSRRAAHCVQKIWASYTASGYLVSAATAPERPLSKPERPRFGPDSTCLDVRGRGEENSPSLSGFPEPASHGEAAPMTVRKWTDDDAKWLKANFGRMDMQTLSKVLGLPLEDLEKKIRQLKLGGTEPDKLRKEPASLKEAVRALSGSGPPSFR